MIKIPQTLKSLTLCTTLAIAASVNGTHPAQAAGIPLTPTEGGFVGAVTYGGTFSKYSVPQKWQFEVNEQPITVPPIVPVKGQSTYTFPVQDPKILVTGTLLPALYRGISEGQRDIVASYTIRAINEQGQRVTSTIENEHQTIKLPIRKANDLSTYIGELTLGVAEARVVGVDVLRKELGTPLGQSIPYVTTVFDDMRGTAGASATGCAFPATGGGPAGINPSTKIGYDSHTVTSNDVAGIDSSVIFPSTAPDYLVGAAHTSINTIMSHQFATIANTQGVDFTDLTGCPQCPYQSSVKWFLAYGNGNENQVKNLTVAARSGCADTSQLLTLIEPMINSHVEINILQYIDKLKGIPLESLNGIFSNIPEGTDGMGLIAAFESSNIGSILLGYQPTVYVRGAMSVVAAPESVEFTSGVNPVSWEATLTIEVSPL